MSFNAPKPARRLLATALAAALSGCATVNGGWRPERTTLTSDPPAAAVTAEGEAVGETPVTAPLRKRPHWWGDGRRAVVLRFEKEGFAASEFQVAPRLNRWIFGNLALAALSGAMAAVDRSHFDGMRPGLVSAGTLLLSVGVDFFSGAAFTLPRSVDTRLTPRPAGASRRRPLDAPAARVSLSFAPKHLNGLPDLRLNDLRIGSPRVSDVRAAVALPAAGASSGSRPSGGDAEPPWMAGFEKLPADEDE